MNINPRIVPTFPIRLNQGNQNTPQTVYEPKKKYDKLRIIIIVLLSIFIFILLFAFNIIAKIGFWYFIFASLTPAVIYYIYYLKKEVQIDVYSIVNLVREKEYAFDGNELDSSANNTKIEEFPFKSGYFHVYFFNPGLFFSIYENEIVRRNYARPETFKREMIQSAIDLGFIAEERRKKEQMRILEEQGYDV